MLLMKFLNLRINQIHPNFASNKLIYDAINFY